MGAGRRFQSIFIFIICVELFISLVEFGVRNSGGVASGKNLSTLVVEIPTRGTNRRWRRWENSNNPYLLR